MFLRPGLQRNVLWLLLALLLALVQQHLVEALMGRQFAVSAEAATGVLTGYPHWRVFQNRLLGPYLVQAISGVTPDFVFAYRVFGVAMLTAAGFLAWRLGVRLRDASTGLLAFGVFQVAFFLVRDRFWLYAWDYVDLVVFLLFASFVVAGRRWPWFVGLFLVAVFNRESAQFIALWLILDPLVRRALAWRRGRPEALDRAAVAAGVACLAFSVWLIEALRQALLVEEVAFKRFGFQQAAEFGPYFHLRVADNLDLLWRALVEPTAGRVVPLLLFVATAAAALVAAVRLGGRFVSLAFLQFAMLFAILLVAVMSELRVFYQMVPFFVLSVTALVAARRGVSAETAPAAPPPMPASGETAPSGPLAIVALVIAIAAVTVATCVPMQSNDFWLQARVGQWIVETGEIPRTLLFPFTEIRDRGFNVHEWVPSVLFHLFVRTLGETGLQFVLGGFGWLLFALSGTLAWRITRNFGASLLLAFCAMAVANYRHYLRPEIVALVLLLLLLHLLVAFQLDGRRRRLLWTVPLAILWANSHGSFLLGPVVAGIFAAGEAGQAAWPLRAQGARAALRAALRAGGPYAAVALAMALASLLNPLGWGMYTFALQLTHSDVARTFLTEWLPTLSPKYLDTRFVLLFLVSVVAVAVLAGVRRERLRWADWLLLLAFGILAFRALRFPILFAFVAIVPCARAIGLRPSKRVERRLLAATTGLATAALALVMMFGNGYGVWPYYAASANFTPGMRERIENPELKGNVFNHYVLGAELIYRAWPRLKPVMDTRMDSYGDEYFVAILALLHDEPRLREFLDRYDVRYMLLMRNDFDDTVRRMGSLQQDGWRILFIDHKAVLLQRPSAPGSASRP